MRLVEVRDTRIGHTLHAFHVETANELLYIQLHSFVGAYGEAAARLRSRHECGTQAADHVPHSRARQEVTGIRAARIGFDHGIKDA